MKRLIYFAISILAILTACKPTEETYKQAYDKAIESRNTDSEITGSTPRNDMGLREIVLAGDTVMMKSRWIQATPGSGSTNDSIKQYNVVAGQFKQSFNANSMAKRLVGMGYAGAFVVQDRERINYVIALSTDDASAAADCLRHLGSEKELALKHPLPYILLTPNKTR